MFLGGLGKISREKSKILKEMGVMRKLIKNNKGFSLVELLIVFAILAIIGAIAFNMFSGMTENAKMKADEETGRMIAQAINAYIADSGDTEFQYAYYKCVAAGDAADTKIRATPLVDDSQDTGTLIRALQSTLYYYESVTGELKQYKNLITPKAGKTGDLTSNFAPQVTDNTGWRIEYYTQNKTCKVIPAKSTKSYFKKIN